MTKPFPPRFAIPVAGTRMSSVLSSMKSGDQYISLEEHEHLLEKARLEAKIDGLQKCLRLVGNHLPTGVTLYPEKWIATYQAELSKLEQV